jgi:arginyl-tRNA synthetase
VEYADQQGVGLEGVIDFSAAALEEIEEFSLLKKLMAFSGIVERVAATLDPHVIPYYLIDVATIFHNFYQKHRVVTDDGELTLARLALVVAAKQVISNGLSLMGVSAPQEM